MPCHRSQRVSTRDSRWRFDFLAFFSSYPKNWQSENNEGFEVRVSTPRGCVVSHPSVVTKVGCDILSWQENACLLLTAETALVRLETFGQSKLLPLACQLSSRHHEDLHLSLTQGNYLAQIPKKAISYSSCCCLPF